MKNVRQMVLVFFGTENRNGIKCTIYKIQVNFSLSLDLKPSTVIQTNGTEYSGCFGKNGKKVIPRKVLFFPGKFPPE